METVLRIFCADLQNQNNSRSVLVVVVGEHKYGCQASKEIVSRSSGY